MTPGLFVLSRDKVFANQVCSRLSSRFQLVVVDCLETAQMRLEPVPIRAVLAHLSGETLNGHTAESFLTELQQTVTVAPIYGLVDPDCPADFRQLAADVVRECLPMPIDYDRLEQLIEQCELPAIDLTGYCTGLPHRALQGKTRLLVTFTPSMFAMFEELRVAAAHDVTILLIGETGSGKTYLARLIHELSSRHNERCLTVGCGALPPDLIESELFGYVKGAFTGADTNKEGKFAAAANGTLLLDEIDVLGPKQQAKLLRVLETGEYEPVGSNDTQTSSARLVVASNYDLDKLVKADKFRIDLYYRLNILSFHLPPLRERPWDIEYLARKFAVEHSRVHNIELRHIEPEFLSALRQYHWPGNIRELENVMRRAVLYCRGGVLAPADLPSALRPANKGNTQGNGSRRPLTLEERVSEIEQRIIEESLRRHNHHRTDTAKELGISRVTLYNKMKKFGMLN